MFACSPILGCVEHLMHLTTVEHGWLWNYTIGQDYVAHPFLRIGIQFTSLFIALLLMNGVIRAILHPNKPQLVAEK